jgi:hypothetical protein
MFSMHVLCCRITMMKHRVLIVTALATALAMAGAVGLVTAGESAAGTLGSAAGPSAAAAQWPGATGKSGVNGWEFNGTYMAWSALNTQTWISCYRNAALNLRATDPQAILDWAINSHAVAHSKKFSVGEWGGAAPQDRSTCGAAPLVNR